MNLIKPTYDYVGWNNSDPDEHLQKYVSVIVENSVNILFKVILDHVTTGIQQEWNGGMYKDYVVNAIV